MTREEIRKAIDALKISAPIMAMTQEEFNDYIQTLNKIMDWLEQEPRKGHWIETAEEYYKAINEKGGGVNENTDYFVDDIACSECLAKFSVIDNETERFECCPNCGADMREVEK